MSGNETNSEVKAESQTPQGSQYDPEKKENATNETSTEEPSNIEGIISSADDKLDDVPEPNKVEVSTTTTATVSSEQSSGGWIQADAVQNWQPVSAATQHTSQALSGVSQVPEGIKVEVFIGGLPPEATEIDVQQALQAVGLDKDYVQTRLIRDKMTALHKGYGFISYSSVEGADRALHFQGNVLVRGRVIRIAPSQKKQRLFVGNLSKDLSRDALYAKISPHVEGIIGMDLPEDSSAPGRNKGYAFLEFSSHIQAENARRIMGRPEFPTTAGFDSAITVDWANAKTDSAGSQQSSSGASNVKSVYVRGTPPGISEDLVRAAFADVASHIEKIVIPQMKPTDVRPKNYCFIHFTTREWADKVVVGGPRNLGGAMVELSIANPESRTRNQQQQQHQQHQLLQLQQLQQLQMLQMQQMGMQPPVGAAAAKPQQGVPAATAFGYSQSNLPYANQNYAQQYANYGQQAYDQSTYTAAQQGQAYNYGQTQAYPQGFQYDQSTQGYGKYQGGAYQQQSGQQRYRPY